MMVQLPIYIGDVPSSLWATMLFPKDSEAARGLSAQLLVRGPLTEWGHVGLGLSVDDVEQAAMGAANGPEARRLKTQQNAAMSTMEVVKVLWGLICTHPTTASWDSAIGVVEDAATEMSLKLGRSTMRAHLAQMRPVLHFWGAFALRGKRWFVDPAVGYLGLDDVSSFMGEAMALRVQLDKWAANIPPAENSLLSGPFYGPWKDWRSPNRQPGWPGTGRLYPVEMPGVLIRTRGKRGRPKTRPTKS